MSEKLLEQILNEVTGMKQGLAEVSKGLTEVRQELAEVHSEVAEVKADVAEVKADVAELKTELAEVKTDVAGLKAELSEVKHTVKQLDTRVTSLEHQFQEFRIEFRTEFQVLKAGQQGIRKEIDDRFKETNEKLHRQEHINDILHRKQLQLEAEIEMLKEK